jgi:hypothetical protein
MPVSDGWDSTVEACERSAAGRAPQVFQNILGSCEAERGGGEGVADVVQQQPGLVDGLADHGLRDAQQVAQDVLGEELPQVEKGDEDAIEAGEHWAAVGSGGMSASAAALPVTALFTLRRLGRSQLLGQRGEFVAWHAGQPWVGQHRQDLLAL